MLTPIVDLLAALGLGISALTGVSADAVSVPAVDDGATTVTQTAEPVSADGRPERARLDLGDISADGYTAPVGDDRVVKSWDISMGGRQVTVEKDIRMTDDGGSLEVQWSAGGRDGGFRISPEGGVEFLP